MKHQSVARMILVITNGHFDRAFSDAPLDLAVLCEIGRGTLLCDSYHRVFNSSYSGRLTAAEVMPEPVTKLFELFGQDRLDYSACGTGKSQRVVIQILNGNLYSLQSDVDLDVIVLETVNGTQAKAIEFDKLKYKYGFVRALYDETAVEHAFRVMSKASFSALVPRTLNAFHALIISAKVATIKMLFHTGI